MVLFISHPCACAEADFSLYDLIDLWNEVRLSLWILMLVD